MKFSIITCTFNSAQYLNKNIDSLTLQVFNDFEHIFIDSFSVDGTVEIINEYQKRFPDKVRLFQYPPKGISNAMNEGIKMAQGDYIIHLHSDDSLYDSNVLKDVADFLSKNNYDWIYGKINVVEESGKDVGIFPNKKIYQGGSDSTWSKFLLKFYNYIPHQAVFIKKEIFSRFGNFDETLKSGMDPDLWLRIKDKTEWFFYDRVISNYCVRSGSETASAMNRLQTIKFKKVVRSRYLNKAEMVLANLVDWLAEIKNKNYR